MDTDLIDFAHTRCIKVCEVLERTGVYAEPLYQKWVEEGSVTWHQRSLFPIWSRSVLWLNSLCRLTTTKDYQAIGTTCRSLYELCLDSILIAKHDDNYAMQQALLAQLDLADLYRRVSNYFDKNDQPIPSYYSVSHEQVTAFCKSAESARLQYWPEQKNAKYPPKHISKKALEAETYAQSFLVSQIGNSLVELYEIDYRLLSSFVHSGLSGIDVWSWEGINALVARALNLSWIFCLTSTQALALHNGFGDQSEEVLAATFEIYNILKSPPNI